MAQPQSSMSFTTAKGAVPTQVVTLFMQQLTIPRKGQEEMRQGKLNVLTTLTFCIHATTEDTIL